MLQPKKPVVKKTTKKDDGNGANDYKNMVDKSTGKKGTMGGEGTNRGPNYNMLKKNGGSVKKAQNGTKVGGPTYVNLKVRNPKAKDSADYKKGYDAVKSGKKTYFPNRATSEGVNEGLGRLNKGVKAKAKSGTSLGMKSVNAGYDNNSGVTRADFVSIGKGKAKSGTKMKMGGKMAKCKYGCN